MLEPKILYKGKLYPKDIIVHFNKQSALKIIPDVESNIETAWTKVYKEGKEQGKLVFDGDIYRVDKIYYSNNKLELTFSKIKFSTRVGIIEMIDKVIGLGDDYMHNNAAIGGLVKTKDNKYIFGIKSGKTLNQNRVDVIGGMIEPKEIIRNGEMLFGENYREIKEEINVGKSDIKDLYMNGVVSTQNGGIIFITTALLNINSDEVREKFKDSSDEEHIDLLFVREDNLNEQLEEMGGYRILIKELII